MKIVNLLVAMVAAAMAMTVVFASSHSEAPGTAGIKPADLTDLYAFRSYESGREDRTVFILNANPVQVPAGGPNFYAMSEDHFYLLHVDNDGDGTEDFSLRWTFGSRLGGVNESTVEVTDDHDTGLCNNMAYFNQTVSFTGIKLDVGTGGNLKQIAIPLKLAGAVTAADRSAQNYFEYYTLDYIVGDVDAPTSVTRLTNATGGTLFYRPMDNAGPKSFPDYETYANQFIYDVTIPGCGTPARIFSGQRAESFSVNLAAIFDLVNMVPVAGVNGAIANDPANNVLAGVNVATLAVEMPTNCVKNSISTVGVWGSVRNLYHNGSEHEMGAQYTRLGQPLVNEVVIGLADKAVFNKLKPRQDASPPSPLPGDAIAKYVTHPTLPELLNILFAPALNGGNRIAPTNIPRLDLVQVFLLGVPGLNTNGFLGEYLRLNVDTAVTAPASQNNLGVIGGDNAGFPNGRRPGDDVVDIALDVMMGRLCTLNINCTASDAPTGSLSFLDGAPQSVNDFALTFPFLRPPHPGFVSNKVVPAPSATTTTSATNNASPASMLESLFE